MKSILTIFLATAFSISAFADKKETIRSLDCTGTVKVGTKTSEIKALITDTKYTDEVGSEYWSTLTITDPVNTSKTLYGNLTSMDTTTDIGAQRDAPRDQDGAGLATYDLFPNKKASTKLERTGLLVVAAPCTAEEEPGVKRCRNPRGYRNYVVEYMYGGSDVTKGPVYTATLLCRNNSTGIAQ